MNKQKILFFITKSNFGGAQKYVFDLATSFSKDNEVVLVTQGEGLLVQKIRTENIPVVLIKELGNKISFLRDVKTFFAFLKILRKEKPAVVSLNSSKAGAIGSLAFIWHKLLFRKTKFIFTCHGYAFNERRPKWQKIVFRLFYIFIIFFTSKTIAVSHSIKNEFAHYPILSKKIKIIHNGISQIDFIEREEVRAKFEIKENEIAVCSISELHPTKALDYSIPAFAQLPDFLDIKYYIFGEGQERAKLEKTIEKYRLNDRVKLLGFVENAPKYLKGFDIFLMPSVSEALAYVVIEAGQAGLPIIASRVGGIPEIIENDELGILIEPKNTKKIAEKITFLAEHPEDRAVYGGNIQKNISAEFSKEQMFARTKKVFLE